MLQPVLYILACALSAHTRVRVSISSSASHLWLAATQLSLPGADSSDILIVLHINTARQINTFRYLTQYRVS